MFERLVMLLATVAAALAFMFASESSASAATKTYYVDVTTCDEQYAGTDADIWVKIDGTSSTTGWVWLNIPYKDTFERGQTDFFEVYGNVGTITNVSIYFDPQGFSPDWRRCGMAISSKDWWDYRNNISWSWYSAKGSYKII